MSAQHYLILAVIGLGFPFVGYWLAFGGSPLEVLNRVLRRLKVPYSFWRFRGNWYKFRDEPGSLTPIIVAGEIRRGLYDLKFNPHESVVDIGAHIGMASIPWAKEHPATNFVAYEPNPANYRNLVRNINANGVKNVQAINEGLARMPCILGHKSFDWNTGGSRSQPTKDLWGVPGVTLQEIKDRHRPTVLKIDCEGGEFGAVEGDVLADVESVVIEIHGHLGDPGPVLEAVQKCPGYVAQVIEHPTQGIYVPGGKFPLKTMFGRHRIA